MKWIQVQHSILITVKTEFQQWINSKEIVIKKNEIFKIYLFNVENDFVLTSEFLELENKYKMLMFIFLSLYSKIVVVSDIIKLCLLTAQ